MATVNSSTLSARTEKKASLAATGTLTGGSRFVRALEVIYSFDPPPFPVYAGQQVDVFINGDRGQ